MCEAKTDLNHGEMEPDDTERDPTKGHDTPSSTRQNPLGLLQLQLLHETKIHPTPVPLSLILGFPWLLGTGIDGKEWHTAP